MTQQLSERQGSWWVSGLLVGVCQPIPSKLTRVDANPDTQARHDEGPLALRRRVI